MDLSQRIDLPELMDTTCLAPALMHKTLKRLSVINHLFGGVSLVVDFFKTCSVHWKDGETISILDVGTGDAEIPRALARWARETRHPLHITGIDKVAETAAIAREKTRAYPEITVRQDDLFALAEKPERFDYVISSLFLHHMPPEKTTAVLSAFDHLARRGVLVSDLYRSRSSYWAVKAMCTVIGNRIVRHDGPLSVRRAFRPAELEDLARRSGLTYVRAAREPWFRVSLAGERTNGA